jgi:hypothetical protein
MWPTLFFPTFQTQYISSNSHQQAVAEHWDLPNTEIFQSKDVASHANYILMSPTDGSAVVRKVTQARTLHKNIYTSIHILYTHLLIYHDDGKSRHFSRG